MIAELTGRRRLFSPRRLINEIVRWILGVCSPSGTIKIHNTAHPDGEQSISLDVDVDAVSGRVAERFGNMPFTADQRKEVCDVVRTHVDDTSVVWRDGGLAVNEEWAKKQTEANLAAPDAGTPTSLLSGAQPTGGGASRNSGSFTATGSGNGVKFLAVTRSYSNGGVSELFFRQMTVAADGRICAVSAEVGSVQVYSD